MKEPCHRLVRGERDTVVRQHLGDLIIERDIVVKHLDRLLHVGFVHTDADSLSHLISHQQEQ